MKIKVLLQVLALCVLSVSLSAGGQTEEKVRKVTLTFPVFSSEEYDYYLNINPMNEALQNEFPHMEIIIERYKSSEDFAQTMQIRASAGELPDIVPLKAYMVSQYSDQMISLNNHSMTPRNKFAEMFAVDGKVVGLPATCVYQFIFYNKAVYNELGLSVPGTWDEFMNNLIKIKNNGKYTPLLMGLKDAWPCYPFNEFMPFLEGGNGNIYNEMAGQSQPFSPGTDFYNTYVRIQELYDADVMGIDPLATSFDESKLQFAAGKGVHLAIHQFMISDFKNNLNGDMDNLGLFFLPVRDSREEPLYTTVMADTFLSIPKTSKYQEEAKQFLDWYFGPYYQEYLTFFRIPSTLKDETANLDPVLAQLENQPAPTYISVIPDGPAFTQMKSDTQFDVKRLGQEMSAGTYKSFDDMMAVLNKKWMAAQN